MAFYKLENNELLNAPNYVLNMDYELYTDKYETYEYPVDGWYWFNTNEEACTFFNLPLPLEKNDGM